VLALALALQLTLLAFPSHLRLIQHRREKLQTLKAHSEE
jgi:hypothetical protein